MKLKDKVVVVTGGASGFGRAIREVYAREGAKVLVADINGQGAREVAKASEGPPRMSRSTCPSAPRSTP